MSGPRKQVRQMRAMIGRVLEFRETGPRPLSEFLNVKFDIERNGEYRRILSISQEDYCRMIVSKYADELGVKSLDQVATPAVHISEQKKNYFALTIFLFLIYLIYLLI